MIRFTLLRSLLLTHLWTLLLTACSDQFIDEAEGPVQPASGVPVSFYIDAGSRTSYDFTDGGAMVGWVNGDQLPIIRVAGKEKIRGTYQAVVQNGQTTFEHIKHTQLTFAEGVDNAFYAYYPWASTTPPAGVALTSTPYQVQSKANNANHLGTYALLKADPVIKPAGDTSPVGLSFTNMLAVIELTLKGDPKHSIDQIRLTSTADALFYTDIKLKLDSSIANDYTTSPITVVNGSQLVCLTLTTPATLSASGQKFYLVVLPGKHPAGSITLTAYRPDGARAEVKMGAIEFAMNSVYHPTVTLSEFIEEEDNGTEIEVKGDLIDIRKLGTDTNLYPQHNGYPMPSEADILFPRYSLAIGLEEGRGPEYIRLNQADRVYMASPKLWHSGWTLSGKKFSSGDKTFYVHYRNCPANEWIAVPYTTGQSSSPIIFGQKLRVAAPTPPGVEITRIAADGFRKRHVTNVNIEILDDGSYLALCTNISANRSTTIYRSTDRGESWSLWSDTASAMNFTRLFQHRGALYVMGTQQNTGHLIICKSTDQGRTWSAPRVIFADQAYHQAPTALVEYNGRLWRAMELQTSNERAYYTPFAISAPVDADLLDPTSWQRTTIPSATTINREWAVPQGYTINGLEEGNMVVGPDGKLYNLLRASSQQTSAIACLARISEPTTDKAPYSFSFTTDDFITMPGGGKKFTVRYDATSQRYWALTNPAEEAGFSHSGIYLNGITFDLMRNRVALCYSSDLKNWTECKTPIVYDPDPFFHGYQYLDWQFDGEDIIAVSRTAHPEERGLPVRQHDANMMLFHRIENFRTLP